MDVLHELHLHQLQPVVERAPGRAGMRWRASNPRTVRPASEDPYGDPADQQFGNVKPASQDPYGDPADQQSGNVRPASEDPYGDPADQGR